MADETTAAVVDVEGTPPAEVVAESPQAPTVEQLQAELAEAQKAIERERNRAKSIEGSVRKKADSEAQIDALVREMRRTRQQVELLSNPDMDDDERRKKLGAIEQEDEQAQALSVQQERQQAQAAKVAKTISARLERAGMSPDDPAFEAANARWEAGLENGYVRDMDALLDALALVDDAVDAAQKAKAAAAAKEAAPKKEPANLDIGLTGGSTAGMSDKATIKAYAEGRVALTAQVKEAFKREGIPL